MNNAPFYIGETIVAIKSLDRLLKKGDEFVVKSCFVFCKCGTWVVDVGFANPLGLEMCHKCYTSVDTDTWFPAAEFFRSIESNKYENIVKELAVLPQDEVPDIKHIKELVN